MYYSAIGFLAILILLIENRGILLKKNHAFDVPVWRVYRKFLFSVLFYYVTDVLWGILQSQKLSKLLFFDTTLYFISMAAGILFWSLYVVTYLNENKGFARVILSVSHSIAAAIILAAVINIFTPVLFTIDENAVYQELAARNILLISQIAILLLISVYGVLFILRRRNLKAMWSRYWTIFAFGIIMAVFLAAQYFWPLLPLYAVAYMLGTVLLHNSVVRIVREEYHSRLMEAEKNRAREEHVAYSRLNALAGDFLCVYIVVPETGRYRVLSATEGFDSFDVPKDGSDFFMISRELGKGVVWKEDLDRYLSSFTREGVLSEIERCGTFSLTYRVLVKGKPNFVQLKAAMVDEKEGRRLIVGLNDIDASVRQEEEYARRLEKAQKQAHVDALTGVRNRHAYLDEEERLNRMIEEGKNPDFALVILDVNDLKKVNDTEGHQAGDKYLRDASRIICQIFKHSPVFRVGGDEFAVEALGEDYVNLEDLIKKVTDHNEKANASAGIVVACGYARHKEKELTEDVYQRADQAMYEDKSRLKKEQGADDEESPDSPLATYDRIIL